MISIQTKQFAQLYSEFNDPNGRIMVVAHRGDWLDAPENTLQSIENAISLGVDMVEIDIQKTRDGKLILMHDETVERMTNGHGAIADLSYDELLSMQVKQSQGGESAELTEAHIPTLEEVMMLVKERTFVNLDKCWDIREDVYDVLRKTGTINHGLFKSDAKVEEVVQFLDSKPIRPEYMHIIQPANAELLSDPDNLMMKIIPKAIEFIFEDEHHPYAVEEAFRMFTGKCRIWVNTMWDSLCAGHSDEKSYTNELDGWGWGIARRVNMIQTDSSRQLLDYLKK
ncbi:glycerophosphodiester phosphodiesterase family protein [Paenibacillus polymyxa]|uniref:glycerophosphodiester phosphodiesterase family protein n=1 Tax=Paenibacillus polymyxa TaxID=1406 RepID=UPI002AB36371|nr:glycerophosphodiester phosphodiesterase family protein [Paenibacillus polymyxa]MDY8024965.1 glycerophosphodiester phosphodiesterase family protein [Paenibacillus polymyxa]